MWQLSGGRRQGREGSRLTLGGRLVSGELEGEARAGQWLPPSQGGARWEAGGVSSHGVPAQLACLGLEDAACIFRVSSLSPPAKSS